MSNGIFKSVQISMKHLLYCCLYNLAYTKDMLNDKWVMLDAFMHNFDFFSYIYTNSISLHHKSNYYLQIMFISIDSKYLRIPLIIL